MDAYQEAGGRAQGEAGCQLRPQLRPEAGQGGRPGCSFPPCIPPRSPPWVLVHPHFQGTVFGKRVTRLHKGFSFLCCLLRDNWVPESNLTLRGSLSGAWPAGLRPAPRRGAAVPWWPQAARAGSDCSQHLPGGAASLRGALQGHAQTQTDEVGNSKCLKVCRHRGASDLSVVYFVFLPCVRRHYDNKIVYDVRLMHVT